MSNSGLVLALAVVVALGGCASLTGLDGGSHYSCKAPDGVTCDSVSGVYANALADNLPSQRRRAPAAAAGSALPASSAGSRRVVAMSNPPAAGAIRSSPRILRLWFKPWEDADHDLYDQGYVYVQVDGGRWRVEHMQRQIRDRYAPIKPPPSSSAPQAKHTSPATPNAGPVALPSAPRRTPADQEK